MSKKKKITAISLSTLFLAAASTTLGVTLSSCAQTGSVSSSNSNSSINYKKTVSNDIQSVLNKEIEKNNIVFPEDKTANNPNLPRIIDIISNATGLVSSQFSVDYGSNWIKVKISSNFNYIFGNAPENTIIQNSGKDLLIQNIEWATNVNDDLQVLLKSYNWWNISKTKLQDYITTNKIFSQYIIKNHTPFANGINQVIFEQMIRKAIDKSTLLSTLRTNFEFNVVFGNKNNGYINGNLEIKSKSPKYLFRNLTNNTTQPQDISISPDRLTLTIQNLQFPTYVLENLNTQEVVTNINNLFSNQNVNTNKIESQDIVDSFKESILKTFGNVQNTIVPVLSMAGENMTVTISVDNKESINYTDFSAPITITIDLGNNSNIDINIPSTSNGIEFSNNILTIHASAPVSSFVVEIQNTNISNDINQIIKNYQIEDYNNLINQPSVISLILQEVNKSMDPSQGSTISNSITQDEINLTSQYTHQSNGVKYYRLVLEIKDTVNKEFSKLENQEINSIEIHDASAQNNKPYKNKILWIKNITYYAPYNLIDTTNLQTRIQDAINELQIISPSLIDNYKDRFFNLVFGNQLSANNATIQAEKDTITIIISDSYPYKFDLGNQNSKIYSATAIQWFIQENTITDETFDLLNQFITENNIQKNTNIDLYSDKLVKKLFGNNIDNSIIGVKMNPVNINDYENNTVKFTFTIDSNIDLTFIQGEINETNLTNFNLVNSKEITISTIVSPIMFEINSDIVSEQFKQTMKEQNVTSFSQIRLSKFKNAFATNVYNALKSIPNNNITNYITDQQFVNYFSKVGFNYEESQTRVKITSNSDNIKYSQSSSENVSIVTNYIYVNEIIFTN